MIFRTMTLICLVLLVFLLSSCKSPKETDDPTTLTEEMIMKTSPCFGKCPYYTMTIYKGGIIRFEGKKFVKKFGLYTKKMKKAEYKALKKAFIAANFWSLENSYNSNISDIPKTRLTFIQDGKTKSIIGDMRRPQVIKDLQKEMEAIANSEEGWTLRSVPNPPIQDFYITNELIISLKPNVDIKAWLNKYKDWKMEVKESINTRKNLWLLKFDRPDLNPAQVINLLSLDDDVMVLEFNKDKSKQ